MTDVARTSDTTRSSFNNLKTFSSEPCPRTAGQRDYARNRAITALLCHCSGMRHNSDERLLEDGAAGFRAVQDGGILQGVSFLLPIEFDLDATFLGAVTGVWAASRRGYDLVGVLVLATVTSVGGGLMRDAIFIAQMPIVVQDARYLWAILSAVLVGALTYRWSERGVHLFSYTDALAMGVYGVYGANWAMISGI